MTLVLATLNGVWADRKITSADGTSCDPMCKIASNESLVAGFAGDYGLMLKACEAVSQGETDIKALAKIGADGCILVSGRLWLIDEKRAWLKPRRVKVIATGSGYAEGLAYLAGRRSLTDKAIVATFRYVATVRDDCGKGFDYVKSS